MFLGFGAAGLGTKTIKNRRKKKTSQCRSAFSYRFLVDFNSILGGFGEPKPIKNRLKKPLKKRPRKNEGQRGPRDPKRVSSPHLHHRFWSPGRSPPYCWVNPSSLRLVIAFGLMTTPPEPSFFDVILVSFPDHFDFIFEPCLCHF